MPAVNGAERLAAVEAIRIAAVPRARHHADGGARRHIRHHT